MPFEIRDLCFFPILNTRCSFILTAFKVGPGFSMETLLVLHLIHTNLRCSGFVRQDFYLISWEVINVGHQQNKKDATNEQLRSL